MKVVVAAENIPALGAGLGYFLTSSLDSLAQAEPSWQFRVVASSSFRELGQIQRPNVKAVFWDSSLPQRAAAKCLGRFLPKSYIPEATYQVSRLSPSRRLRARWGNLEAIYATMHDADVIWLPHYAIRDSERLSSLKNLGHVRCPVLMTIHDIHPVFFPDDWPPQALKAFWEGFVPFARGCECIITHTEHQRQLIIDHLKTDADRVRVTPVPPILDPAPLFQKHDRKENQALLSHYGISSPFVLYPGSGSHTHKNHTRLLLAWAELKRRLGDQCPMLVCTAKGHLWPALKALTDALGIQDRVVFTDTVDTAALAQLYDACVLVAVPTLYEGGGSGPVAEAILAGKPVVCSDIPQIRQQLSAYGLDSELNPIAFFSPDSVDAIVTAVEGAMAHLPGTEPGVLKAQALLASRISGLWEDWARFYAAEMRRIAHQRS